MPRHQFPGEPGDGDLTVDNQTHQLVLDQALGETWKLRAGLSWRGTRLQGISTEPSSLRADNRTLWRQRRDRDYDSRDIALQAELQGQLRSGALVHELLISTEAYSFRMDQRMLRINPSSTAPYALDLLAPVYGQTPPTPLPNTDTHETQRGLALTLQDALRLGNAWRLVAGVRLDRVEQALDNRRNGQRTEQSPSEASPRLGLSYLANRGRCSPTPAAASAPTPPAPPAWPCRQNKAAPWKPAPSGKRPTNAWAPRWLSSTSKSATSSPRARARAATPSPPGACAAVAWKPTWPASGRRTGVSAPAWVITTWPCWTTTPWPWANAC